MKDNNGIEGMNVDVLGQEKRVIAAFDEKDVPHRQRINQTISITKRGRKMIGWALAIGVCINMLFPTTIWCIQFDSAENSGPKTNIVESHDNSWLELEESPMFWSGSVEYPMLGGSPPDPEPEHQIEFKPPLNWYLLHGRRGPESQIKEPMIDCFAHLPSFML